MTIELYHTVLEYFRRLIEATPWEGHVFAVGGCCRDEQLGHPINDIDLAIDLPNGGVDFAMWLHHKGLTLKEPVVFAAFGTAKLTLKTFPDFEIETVQTRREKYTDSTRRDPTVVYGSKEDDCRRRDLTVNALYYDISNRKLLDVLGCSLGDIENRIIRTPADPNTTFDDDPVRILRAIRFAARYGWELDPLTWEGLCRNVSRLEIVRKERMQAEFEKILCCPRPALGMQLLADSGALEYVIPELLPTVSMKQNHYHFGTVWEHTLALLDKVPTIPLLRMTALLHDIGKPATRSVDKKGHVHFYGHERACRRVIDKVLRRLRYDSDFINKVVFLATNHMLAKTWGPAAEKMKDSDLRRLQHKCGSNERFTRLMHIIHADNCAHAPEHCMPDQTLHIIRRSDELLHHGTAMFSYHQPLPSVRIRKIKGLGRDADLKPYLDFLFDLALKYPKKPKEFYVRRLQAFNPPKKSNKSNG